MQNWQVVLLVISAIFVGMWIPVSIQLIATLRSGQRFIVDLGSRSEKTLAELSSASVAFGKTVADVEKVAHSAVQIKDSIHLMSSIGAAVVPAVTAFIRAFRESTLSTDHPGGNDAPHGTERPEPTQKESTQ